MAILTGQNIPTRYVARRLQQAFRDEILKLLQGNALETRENIAKQLNLPVAEVAKRIADYEKTDVIRSYHAVLNKDLLDLDKVTAHDKSGADNWSMARR